MEVLGINGELCNQDLYNHNLTNQESKRFGAVEAFGKSQSSRQRYKQHQALSSLSNLNKSDLSGNRISDVTLPSNLHRLESIELRKNQLSKLCPLNALHQLQWLERTDNFPRVEMRDYLSTLNSTIEAKNLGLVPYDKLTCLPQK